MSADAYVMPPAPAETLAEVTRQRDEARAMLRRIFDETIAAGFTQKKKSNAIARIRSFATMGIDRAGGRP